MEILFLTHPLCSRSFLESLKVNTEPLPGIEKTGKVRGLILTLKGEPGGQTAPYDFYSRYFAPWVGVAEDPVTGTLYLKSGRFNLGIGGIKQLATHLGAVLLGL